MSKSTILRDPVGAKFNASLIKRWMACPLQQKLDQDFEVPLQVSGAMQFGTEIHAALESILTGASHEDALALFFANWEDALEKIDYYHNRTSWENYRSRGISILDTFCSEREWGATVVLATEHRFAIPYGNHIVSGIVDLLEYDPATNTLKIVDFKSGSRPNKDQLHMDVQFTTYALAAKKKEFWLGNPVEGARYEGFQEGEELYERFRDVKHKYVWYDLRNNKEYDCGPRGDIDFLKLYRTMDEIERAIRLDVYVPNISWDSCGYCDYKDVCPAYSLPENSGLSLDEVEVSVKMSFGK